jgi:serine/threonine protein kinase
MLFGTDAPFVWASPQDARYMEICVKGNLQGLASNQSSKFGMRPEGDHISAEGIDLIQNMLRANPADRLNLEQTMQHPWLQGEMAVPDFPTPLMKKREE